MTAALLPLAALVAVAYGVQSASGFGAGLILVTLGMHLIELPTLLALILPLSVAQTGWITARHWRAIDRTVLARRVLPLMGVGTAAGYLISTRVGGSSGVKQAMGALVILLASREIWRLYRRTPPAQGGRAVSMVSIFAAGVVHGIYATGGPLLIYGLGREGLDRARFRATITSVWLLLNIVLVTTFAIEGRYTPAVRTQLAVLFPGIVVGIFAGERVFARLDERTFQWGVYGLLLLAGVPLLWG